MSGEPNAIRLLVKYGAFVNAKNDEMRTPLFNAILVNNPLAVASLIELNADYRIKDESGLSAFDLIKDVDEWIKCDCFDNHMKKVLKSMRNFLFFNISAA